VVVHRRLRMFGLEIMMEITSIHLPASEFLAGKEPTTIKFYLLHPVLSPKLGCTSAWDCVPTVVGITPGVLIASYVDEPVVSQLLERVATFVCSRPSSRRPSSLCGRLLPRRTPQRFTSGRMQAASRSFSNTWSWVASRGCPKCLKGHFLLPSAMVATLPGCAQ
jgi:hypothetical protein